MYKGGHCPPTFFMTMLDTKTFLFEDLEEKLLALGGERVLHTLEEDLHHLMTRGKVLQAPVKAIKSYQGVKMEPSQCHYNSGLYWDIQKHLYGRDRAAKNVSIYTGWSLAENYWYQHSWVYLKNTKRIVETTTPRDIYFGFELTPDEADTFYLMNL